jgi:hypothetical protein
MKEKAEDLKNQAAEIVKKVVTVGVGTLFLTEESLRGLVSDFKIPKELLSGILDSANKTRKEFLSKLSSDALDRIAERVDARQLIDDVLKNHEIEVNLKIQFHPKKKSDSSGT